MSQGEGGGRVPTELTDEQKMQVEALAAYLNSEQIAEFLGISRTTFYSIMKRDPEVSERYKRGRAKVIGSVGKSLIQNALEGNITAQIFYMKTQAGWKETEGIENSVEVKGFRVVEDDT